VGPPGSSEFIDLLRTLLAVVAGLWVLFLYRRRREGKAVVRLALSGRSGVGPSGERGLFVRVHAANVSAVLLRRVDAVLTLLAPARLDVESLRFEVLARSDPLRPLSDAQQGADTEEDFVKDATQFLEPGECIESEAFVPLPERTPRTVGLRLQLFGTHGRTLAREFEWVAFAFVTLDQLNEDLCPITCHAHGMAEVHSKP